MLLNPNRPSVLPIILCVVSCCCCCYGDRWRSAAEAGECERGAERRLWQCVFATVAGASRPSAARHRRQTGDTDVAHRPSGPTGPLVTVRRLNLAELWRAWCRYSAHRHIPPDVLCLAVEVTSVMGSVFWADVACVDRTVHIYFRSFTFSFAFLNSGLDYTCATFFLWISHMVICVQMTLVYWQHCVMKKSSHIPTSVLLWKEFRSGMKPSFGHVARMLFTIAAHWALKILVPSSGLSA